MIDDDDGEDNDGAPRPPTPSAPSAATDARARLEKLKSDAETAPPLQPLPYTPADVPAGGQSSKYKTDVRFTCPNCGAGYRNKKSYDTHVAQIPIKCQKTKPLAGQDYTGGTVAEESCSLELTQHPRIRILYSDVRGCVRSFIDDIILILTTNQM